MSAPAVHPAPELAEGGPEPRPTGAPLGQGGRLWVGAAASLALAAGVALRCWSPAHLWLDEALSVNIARLPLGELPEALRHDGAPPLYYLLLHGWVRLFGTGDLAVRSLSGLLSIMTLPVMWLAGRRVGGRSTAWAALILLAASPFAIRYATEARMYSLVILLTLLGYLAVVRALERPTLGRLAGVTMITTALLVTHYWAIYLLVLVAVVLVVRARRGGDVRAAGRTLLAMGVGALLFLPWLPNFVYQLRHTGTPWAARPTLGSIVTALEEFGGGRGGLAPISSLLFLLLALLGLFAQAVDGRRVELDLRTRPEGRAIAFVGVGSVVVGVMVGVLAGAGYAIRYTAMALPLYVLLAALGTRALADRRLHLGALAVVAVLGLATGAWTSLTERTTAGTVAAVLADRGRPGDVVAYCPDQLGPAVSRLLPPGFDQVPFPRGQNPERVDWVDYAQVNQAADPRPFADMLLRRAGDRDIWVVWSPGYRTFGAKCETLIAALRAERPAMTRPVRVKLRYPEHPGLVHFPR